MRYWNAYHGARGPIPRKVFAVDNYGDLADFRGSPVLRSPDDLAFLRHGVAEANPLVRLALRLCASPALPLLAVKIAGCALAWFAWRTSRMRLLRRINIFFAVCVAWNLLIVAGA